MMYPKQKQAEQESDPPVTETEKVTKWGALLLAFLTVVFFFIKLMFL